MRFLAPPPSALVIMLTLLGVVAGNPVAPAAAATPIPQPAAAPAPDSDAAAKHARLTVCLRQAKAKKLFGTQKTAFIKECVAARA